MLFPELQNKRSAFINLGAEAKKWLVEHPSTSENQFLDPTACGQFVDECHRKLGVDFSYGGYLEDREILWRGSYIDADRRYIHLGVDFNVPAATKIAIDHPAKVIRIDDDYPDRHGWGTRVILQEPGSNVVMLFAHLDRQINISVGDELEAGTIFAKVGIPPYNGDWFPHLHVQIIDRDHYFELLKNNLRDLDGYGRKEDLDTLKTNFLDPLKFVSVD